MHSSYQQKFSNMLCDVPVSFFFFFFPLDLEENQVLSDTTLGKFVEEVWLLVEIVINLCQLWQNIQVSICPRNGKT